eukprot:UN1850
MQQQRRDHFCSSSFSADEPGALFPASWSSLVKLSYEGAKEEQMHARPDYKDHVDLIESALKSAASTFDKTAEDGARFRIYKVGNLEVRTIQQHSEDEAIAGVFSSRKPADGAN